MFGGRYTRVSVSIYFVYSVRLNTSTSNNVLMLASAAGSLFEYVCVVKKKVLRDFDRSWFWRGIHYDFFDVLNSKKNIFFKCNSTCCC